MLLRHCLSYFSIVAHFKLGSIVLQIAIFQCCFGYSGSLAFPYEFTTSLLIFAKETGLSNKITTTKGKLGFLSKGQV